MQKPYPLRQWSPTFLAPGTGFVEDNFSMDQGMGWGGWCLDVSGVVHLLRTLFLLLLHQLHLRYQVLDPGGWGPLQRTQ